MPCEQIINHHVLGGTPRFQIPEAQMRPALWVVQLRINKGGGGNGKVSLPSARTSDLE